jgi:hypothetical protein
MDRGTVYKVIEKEREYQNGKWPRDNHPLIKQYAYAAPHLLLLEEYATKARALWTKSQDEVGVLKTIAKMATIAFRALEEIVDKSGHFMTQHEIISAVSAEQDYQDGRCWRTEGMAGQYKFSAPHLLLVENRIYLARSNWICENQGATLNSFVKVAAVLVRALEEIDGPNLLFTGLR